MIRSYSRGLFIWSMQKSSYFTISIFAAHLALIWIFLQYLIFAHAQFNRFNIKRWKCLHEEKKKQKTQNSNVCNCLCRAQEFYMKNMFAMFVGKLCGLLAVLTIPSILRVLMCTRASSTPFTAYKRYMQTIFHTICWYEHELKPGSRWVDTYIFFRKSLIISCNVTLACNWLNLVFDEQF